MICKLSRVPAFKRIALLVFIVFAARARVAAKSHEISFRLKEGGQVSAAVYDATKGKMLRELSRGTRMEPGGKEMDSSALAEDYNSVNRVLFEKRRSG